MAETMMNIFSLLDVFGKMSTTDIASQYMFEKQIMYDILAPLRTLKGKKGYDNETPGTFPVSVTPILLIDHVETFDEEQQVMSLNGGFMFVWFDPRLVWNATKYGGIKVFSKSRTTLRGLDRSPYLPRIHVTDLASKTADILKMDDVEFQFTNNGRVVARIRTHIKSSCYFTYSNYPYDSQNCSFSLYSPQGSDLFVFTGMGAISKSKRQLSLQGLPMFIDVKDFVLTNIEQDRVHLLPGSKLITNPEAYPARLVRSVFWFNLIFTRQNKYYIPQMALPLFLISACTYFVGLVPSQDGVIWLMIMIGVQVINGAELVEQLPPDYDGMTTIGVLATVILVQSMCLVLWRLAYLMMMANYANRPDIMKNVQTTEWSLRFVTPLVMYLNFYFLFEYNNPKFY